MALCLIGLGSNLGDRQGNLKRALGMLDDLESTHVAKQSSSIETRPVGLNSALPTSSCAADSQDFLNSAALLETSLTPSQLLGATQEIEQQMGRTSKGDWGPRTIDLDILLYGNEVVAEDDLIVPHPWLCVRRFALQPSVEIAPETTHPLLGRDLQSLFQRLKSMGSTTLLISTPPHPELEDGIEAFGTAISVEATKCRHSSLRCKQWSIILGDWAVDPDRVDRETDLVHIMCDQGLGHRDNVAGALIAATVPGEDAPRVIVGVIERTAFRSPWRQSDTTSVGVQVADAILKTSSPFVLLPHGPDIQSQIAAAIASSL